MSNKNYVIYGDEKKLRILEEEYQSLGRETLREEGQLTIFALPQKKIEKEKPKKSFKTKTDRSFDRR